MQGQDLDDSEANRAEALSFALSQPRKIAIVGDPHAGDTQALLRVVRNSYRPY
jgi:hypothetical protein